MSEKERRAVLAKVPCDDLKNPFTGLVSNGTEQEMKNEIVDFLSASAQFEKQFIKQKTEELSKLLAEENVNLMFAHLNHVREQGHINTLPEDYQHVDCGESSSSLNTWANLTSRRVSKEPSGRKEDKLMQSKDQHGYQAD
ncbi:unnamed protein product [Lampetra fluviatilis]